MTTSEPVNPIPPPVATATTWSWRPVVGQALIAAVLLLILYVLASLSAITLSPLAAPSQLVATQWPHHIIPANSLLYSQTELNMLQTWRDSFGQVQPLTRTVTISTTSNQLQISFDLLVTSTHPIVNFVTSGALDATFTQGAFGTLINYASHGLPVRNFSLPTWTIDRNTGLFQLHQETTVPLDQNGLGIIELARYGWDNQTRPLFVPRYDEFVLKLGNSHLYQFDPIPDESRAGTVTLTRTAPDSVPGVYFLLSAQVLQGENLQAALQAGSTSPANLTKPVDTTQNLLQQLGQVALPLDSFWRYGLGLALPLLIFWYWLRGGAVGSTTWSPRNLGSISTKALAKVVVSVLLFHVIVYALAAGDFIGLGRLLFLTPYNDRIFAFAGDWLFRLRGSDWITLIVLGIVLPAALTQQSNPRPAISGSRLLLRAVLSLVIVLVGVVAVGVAMQSWPDFYVWQIVLGGTAICAVMMFLALVGLHRVLAGKPARPEIAALAVVILLAMQSLAAFGQLESVGSTARGEPLKSFESWLLGWTHQASMTSLIWTVIYTGLGAFLILSLVRVALGFVREISPGWSLPKWAKWLGLALAVFLAIPSLTSRGNINLTASADPILSLAYSLSALARLAWLGGAVWLMYQAGKAGQAIRPFVRALGLLAVSTLFFDVTENWLYVPITILLGWWALQRVVKPARYWRSLKPLLQPVFKDRAKLLDQIIDLNSAEKAFGAFRKNQGAKLSTGELTFAEYDKSIEEQRQALQRRQDGATVMERPVRDVALEFGPYETSWRNGLHGTRMSLLFATPWLIVFIQQLLPQVVGANETYYVWVLVRSVAVVLAKWAVFGFFFGYFYPYLWGKNGLEKGLVLFAATTLPALPYTVLNNTSTVMWQASLFVILQAFTQCMLLGLVAFDYFSLRQGRYDWQMVLEVHGLTFVGLSISTILAAVGVTITTVLTAGATNWVTLLLNAFLPHVSPPGG